MLQCALTERLARRILPNGKIAPVAAAAAAAEPIATIATVPIVRAIVVRRIARSPSSRFSSLRRAHRRRRASHRAVAPRPRPRFRRRARHAPRRRARHRASRDRPRRPARRRVGHRRRRVVSVSNLFKPRAIVRSFDRSSFVVRRSFGVARARRASRSSRSFASRAVRDRRGVDATVRRAMTIDVENATTVGVGTQPSARGDDGSTRRIDEDARDDCETLITNQAMRSKGWRSSNPTATPRAATSSIRGSFLPTRKNARRLRANEPRSNGLANLPSADLR